MPKDKLQISSLSGGRYSLLIFKLWFPAFREVRGTELYLEYIFYIAFAVIIYPFFLEMRFAQYKKTALEKNYQNTLLCFSSFQTPSSIYTTSREAKTCNWVERRVGNSKYILSSEMQTFILMFTHILMLQEDWTLWHKSNSLCQSDCLMLHWLCDKARPYRNAGIVFWSKRALMALNLSCALTCFPPLTVTSLHCHQLFLEPPLYDILLV